jgi:DNA-binding response OmpR family regulator
MALILIADDDQLIIQIVQTALSARGHTVGGVEDGLRVLSVVELKRPALVILDCMMAEVSGIEALRQIRSSRTCFATPVLMLTARCSEADEEIAMRHGADDYLRKPFGSDLLVARAERLIERTKKRQLAAIAPSFRPDWMRARCAGVKDRQHLGATSGVATIGPNGHF